MFWRRCRHCRFYLIDPVVIGVVGGALTSFFTLITIVVNAIVTRMRESRHRKWDVQDRESQALAATMNAMAIQKAIAENTTQTTNAAKQAVSNAKLTEAATVSLHKAIAENTAQTKEASVAAKAAFDEANNVNQKLARLAIRVRQDLHDKTGGGVVLAEIVPAEGPPSA